MEVFRFFVLDNTQPQQQVKPDVAKEALVFNCFSRQVKAPSYIVS